MGGRGIKKSFLNREETVAKMGGDGSSNLTIYLFNYLTNSLCELCEKNEGWCALLSLNYKNLGR